MTHCKICGKPLTLTPEYDMCLECQGKQHRTFTIPDNRGSVSNKTEMSKEMTPKEALELLKKNGFVNERTMNKLLLIEKALTERDIYYQALCDIESGKDVRMILERVLT